MGIKNLAYKIMSQSGAQSRSTRDILRAIVSKDPPEYTGGWDPETGKRYTNRDLNYLYLYGNTKGQFTPYTGTAGVSYDNYLYGIGKDPALISEYEGRIVHDDLSNTFPSYAQPYIENLARSGYGRTIGYDYAYGDNVAGHVGKVGINRNGEPAIIVSDLWDFYPKDFVNKWVTDRLKWQSALLDKVGTPFILRDDTSNVIKYSDDEEDIWLSPQQAAIMISAGIIPEVTVTPSVKGLDDASVHVHGQHWAALKQGGTLNYLNFFK